MDRSQTKPGTSLLPNFLTAHPASVGESYGQHFVFALRFACRLFVAGGAAMVHAVIPSLCETTASRCIRAMHDDLTRRHGKG